MDWKWQLVISIGVPIFTAVLSYLAARGKSKADIKAVQINADTEIKKIREQSDKEIKNIELEYQKQIEKMKEETEQQIKLKMAESELASKGNEDKIKSDAMGMFLGEFMKDPKASAEKLKSMQDVAKMFDIKK